MKDFQHVLLVAVLNVLLIAVSFKSMKRADEIKQLKIALSQYTTEGT